MARILVTGAAEGLGFGAALELVDHGHVVLAHARNSRRAEQLDDLVQRGAIAVTADLSDLEETRALADQVTALGGVDAIIHNAGVLDGAALLPVNVVAPYLLTAQLPAQRQVYLSSGMHHGGHARIDGLDWGGTRGTASYSDSKLFVTTLAAAVARLRPGVFSNAVDPGWVPTRMGGASAPDDLRLGHRTQTWLAEADDPATHTSGYWYHQRRRTPHPAVHDERFQHELLDALASHSGARLDLGR